MMYYLQYGNIRNQNADGMPQIMLYGGLLCSSSWLIYGLMLNDFNVYVSQILIIFALNFTTELQFRHNVFA